MITLTAFDLYWAKKVALFAKKDLYGIGNDTSFWALMWEAMVVDATDHAADCTSNVIICNSIT